MPAANTGGQAAQAAAGTQPQEGASQAQAATADAAQAAAAGSGDGTVDAAALQRELAEARQEAAKYRTQARDLQAAQQQAQDAALSDAERNAKRVQEQEAELATLRAALDDERILNRVTLTAGRLGYADPMDAYRLLDRSAIERDDDGNPKNLERLLQTMLAGKPYLASSQVRATGSAEGGTRGTGTAGKSDMNALIRQAAGRS